MASPALDSPWPTSPSDSFSGSFNIHMEEQNPADIIPVLEDLTSSVSYSQTIPKPPPVLGNTYAGNKSVKRLSESCSVPKETIDTWDKLFKEGCGADVYIITEGKSYIPAHFSVLVSNLNGILSSLLTNSNVIGLVRGLWDMDNEVNFLLVGYSIKCADGCITSAR